MQNINWSKPTWKVMKMKNTSNLCVKKFFNDIPRYSKIRKNFKYHRKEAQNRVLTNSLNQQIEVLLREKKYLESQLEIEKVKTENDAKKFQSLLNEYTKEKEQKMKQQQSQSVILNDSTNIVQNTTNMRYSSTTSLYDASRSFVDFNSLNNSGAINILESLQSKLKQKDGEIAQLQIEIQNLERTRESMAKEMVNLTDKLDKSKQNLKDFPKLQEEYNVTTCLNI
jgi:hypothetical protein